MRAMRFAVLIVMVALSGAASAASTVTIYSQLETPPGPTAVFGLYVQNSLGVSLGAVDLLVEGSTGFTFDSSTPGLSLPDSVYDTGSIPGYPWAVLVANNTALGVTLVPAGGTTRLGAFNPGDLPTLLPGETPDPNGPGTLFAATLFDAQGSAIRAADIVAGCVASSPGHTCVTGLLITVPEPAVLALVALVLFAVITGTRSRPCAS